MNQIDNSKNIHTVPYFTKRHLKEAFRLGLGSEETSDILDQYFPEHLHMAKQLM